MVCASSSVASVCCPNAEAAIKHKTIKNSGFKFCSLFKNQGFPFVLEKPFLSFRFDISRKTRYLYGTFIPIDRTCSKSPARYVPGRSRFLHLKRNLRPPEAAIETQD